MYIREYASINKKTGIKYVKHRLVESVQTEKGPRQRVIMYLGELNIPKSEWRILAAVLEARLASQLSLFEEQCPEIATIADQVMKNYGFTVKRKEQQDVRRDDEDLVLVDLNSSRTQTCRSLGPELVGHAMWNRLQFDPLLNSVGFSEKEMALAQAVVIGRLVEPGSDRNTWSWLQSRTSLAEFLPCDISGVGKDAVYEIADKLFLHKAVIERSLRQRETGLFSYRPSLFLYDLTNLYLEGAAKKNTLAKHGKSKEKRSDCPLVTLALMVDEFGFPLFSQIYAGNQSEPQTLPDVLKKLKEDMGSQIGEIMPTIIMDRGIATKANIALLKEAKYHYLVIERRPTEKDYVADFANARETFTKLAIHPSEKNTRCVYVKKVSLDTGCRVLCFSDGREQKECAMDGLKEKRFLEDIGKLSESIQKNNIILVEKVAERLGRIKAKYPTVTRYYDIQLELDEKDARKTHQIKWNKKEAKEKHDILNGCYVIETTHENLSAEEIWRHYTTLARIEDAFRHLKSDLGIRPVFHQLAHRTEAHLFISVLAYHLLNSMEHQLKSSGDYRRWPTIKQILSSHSRSTIVQIGADNKVYYIRLSSTPESSQREIYRLLNVKDPLKNIRSSIKSHL